MAHTMSARLQWFHPKRMAKNCAKAPKAEEENAVCDLQDYEEEEKDDRLEGDEEEIAVPPESHMGIHQLTRRAGYSNHHPGVNS